MPPSSRTIVFAIAFLALPAAAESDAGQATSALPPRMEDEMRIHFYNVGAGTCTLIECPGPDASPIVVDCGESVGGRGIHAISRRALKARMRHAIGSRSPDVVLSHSDGDHVSLIPHVLDGIRAATIWQGDQPIDYPDDVREWIAGQKQGGAVLHRGFSADWHHDAKVIDDGLQCGKASSYVLTVNSGLGDGQVKDDNANSLVLMLTYGRFSTIFTGDATGATEDAARTNFPKRLDTTVLTASHHGASSAGSNGPEWASATQPKIVVYSAGTKHGHPRCVARDVLVDTLATVPEHNAICGTSNSDYRTYPTGRAEYMTRVNGAITITTDGRSPLRLDCEVGTGCDAVEIPF